VKHTMESVMRAITAVNGLPMLTTNQCHALAAQLNATDELTEIKEAYRNLPHTPDPDWPDNSQSFGGFVAGWRARGSVL
jgi:hypothetical protein